MHITLDLAAEIQVNWLPDITQDVDRDTIIRFYEENYSSHLMSLSVLGKESLDDMEKIVRQRFEAVPRRDISVQKNDDKILLDNQFARMLKVVPEKEVRGVSSQGQRTSFIPIFIF